MKFVFEAFLLSLFISIILLIWGVEYIKYISNFVYEFRTSNRKEFLSCVFKDSCEALFEKFKNSPIRRGCIALGKVYNNKHTKFLCKNMKKNTVLNTYSASKWVSSALIWKYAQYLGLGYNVSVQELDSEWSRNLNRELKLSDLVGLKSGLECQTIETNPKFVNEPGIVFEYCGESFTIAFDILARYTNTTFDDLLRTTLFEGMTFESLLFPNNKRLDVSLRTSIYHYSIFLEALTNQSLIKQPLLDFMHHDIIEIDDGESYIGYAQGNWKEVGNISSSRGTGGFVPWWNHNDNYFGIIAIDYVADYVTGPCFVLFLLLLLLLSIRYPIKKS